MEKPIKNIVILGAGESGIGAAILAKQKGFRVFVSSLNEIAPAHVETLNQHDIMWESGEHSEMEIHTADLIIKSPGIPEKAPIIKLARAHNIPIEGEIAFAMRFVEGKVIAITGSNGKTTTTLLTHHILKNAGAKVALAGNVGTSLARVVASGETYDYYVVEISSFQLDDAPNFKPHVAILTNITPDHLDRYDYSMEAYAKSKFGITRNQGAEDFFIYNADDPYTVEYLHEWGSPAQKLPISLEEKLEVGAWLEQQQIIIKTQNHQDMNLDELALQGKHNAYNSMAAGLAARLVNIRKEVIRDSLADFETIEHRLEPVLEVGGVEYINDSKATNVNSTYYALESMKRPVVWIVGGVDKGNDYSQIKPLVEQKVKAIVCLGLDNDKIIQEFADSVEMIIETQRMQDAVQMARQVSEKGDCVLLSPACASFDLFENYEDRGRQFKEMVRRL